MRIYSKDNKINLKWHKLRQNDFCMLKSYTQNSNCKQYIHIISLNYDVFYTDCTITFKSLLLRLITGMSL